MTNFPASPVYLTTDSEDTRLAIRSQAGDAAAFEALVRRYQRVLFNVALRMLGNRDEAADATQETFLKAYAHLDGFDAERRFFSWIYQILSNTCLNVLRSRRAQPAPPVEDAVFETPLTALEAGERRAQVQAALMQLSVPQREAVVLRHFADLSYAQIASTLGISVVTVKSRLHEGRERLAQLLSNTKGYAHASGR